MKKGLALVVLAAALVWPTTAGADAPVPWQQKALATAQRVWHPTCGVLTLTFEAAAASNVADSATAEVVVDAAGWTVIGSCGLHLSDSRDWRSLGYPVMCSVLLHEAGHGARMPDTFGPGIMKGNVMPSRGRGTVEGRRVTLWSDVDRRCIRPMDRTWVPRSDSGA